MEYETWFWGNVRVVPKDPALPSSHGGDYSNVAIVRDGPPVAHAVAPGSNIPECGTAGRSCPMDSPGLTNFPAIFNDAPRASAATQSRRLRIDLLSSSLRAVQPACARNGHERS